MAGLLDMYLLAGNSQALTVLTGMASWVKLRNDRLSLCQRQNMLDTEFGGMNEVLTNLYQVTGDANHLAAAQQFDHAEIFDPLASNTDRLKLTRQPSLTDPSRAGYMDYYEKAGGNGRTATLTGTTWTTRRTSGRWDSTAPMRTRHCRPEFWPVPVIFDRRLGAPRRRHHLEPDLRLRHRGDRQHVPDPAVEHGDRPIRHHHQWRRWRAADRRPGRPARRGVDARGGDQVGLHRHPLCRRR
jgi:hypothetical protein